MVFCNIQGCNQEAQFAVMFYHFDRIHKKPFCKEIIRTCGDHAFQLADENTITRIQVLS